MAPSAQNLVKLVQSGNYGKVEDAWMQAAGESGADLAGLTPVLGALVKAGQAESAEVLAFATFNEHRERLDAADRLELIKAMSIAIPASDELRRELVDQIRSFHADHPKLESLLNSSGLANGSKTPRLALRTLDLCLVAAPGTFLLSRRDDTIAQIEEVADDSSTYTVSFNNRRREYETAELAVEFGPVDFDDFRVLSQHRPERLAELLDKDPTTIIVSLVRSQSERFTVDDLRFALCPRYLSSDKWTKWWTKARMHLKKTHTVRLEGRNPATLVYDATEWTIEDMFWEKFPKSEDATEYFDAVESYFREAKSRSLKVKPEYLNRMAVALCDRIKGVGRHAADRGLCAVLTLEGLLHRGAALDAEPPISAVEMIRAAEDPQALLANLTDDRLWIPALASAREALSEKWPETFAALLPTASMAGCAPIAAELHAAGRSDLLGSCVEKIMNEPGDCIEAIAWMWKGSESLNADIIPSRLEMLVRILSTLAELDRSGIERRRRAKTVRAAVKNALGSANCAGFRECLDGMEESMASTIRRQVARLDGLGPALRDQMIEEIRKRFPALWVKKKIDPWKDDSMIFTTEAGLKKLQADIDHIVNVEMPANAKAIGEAAAHGDLSENSEYKFALEARDMLRARLAAMQNQIVRAQVIEPQEITTHFVGIGTRVTLRRGHDGGIRTMTFLGPWDAAIENGIFNYQAPLSQQLMGRNAGDTLTIALDDGHDEEWTVERIEAGL